MINIYFQRRPDMQGCHVFDDLARAGELLGDQVIVGDRWRPHMDANVCVDTGHVLPPPPEERERSYFWCLHCHTQYHQAFARNFERSFGADLRYVELGLFDEWLPNGVGTSAIHLSTDKQVVDVGFVGQFLGHRIGAIDYLRRECDRQGWSHHLVDSHAGRSGDEGTMARPSWMTATDFANSMAWCKVWFNATTEPNNALLNNRIFEGMAAGRAVLTDDMHGSRLLAPSGTGVVYYDWKNLSSMQAGLDYLMMGENWKSVGLAGHQAVQKHTIEARLRKLLKSIGRRV